jgi:prepilin-type N-terminal cleavage/methylation domain-containing protein
MINQIKTKKGFSLMELILSVAIFVIVMVSVASIFAKSFQSYRRNKLIQRDMETAQQAMNFIAKTLRTSTVITGASGVYTTLTVYDYSRGIAGECIEFNFTGSIIQYRLATGTPPICNAFGTWRTLTSASDVLVQNAGFTVTKSSFTPGPAGAGVVGKITTAFDVCPPAGCAGSNDQARIQTTVSLRDYDFSGVNR